MSDSYSSSSTDKYRDRGGGGGGGGGGDRREDTRSRRDDRDSKRDNRGDREREREDRDREDRDKRDKDRDRDRDRDRNRDRDRDREDRDRDREDRDRDRDRDRNRDRDKDRDDRDRRDLDRERENNSRTFKSVDRRDIRDSRDNRYNARFERDEEKTVDKRKERNPDSDSEDAIKEKRRRDGTEADLTDTLESAVRKVPMDVEDLLKKKQEEQESQVKPKFLTLEEREKLALERRAQAAAERISKLEEQRKSREDFFKEASKEDDRMKKDRFRDKRVREWDRGRERDDRDKEKAKKENDTNTEKELDIIKQTYLGMKKEKKKLIKPSEKFKFVFDWATEDDTSRDVNPLYSNKHEIRPQFGRGFIAGIDPKEQAKDYKKFLQQELKDSGKANAAQTISKKLSTLEKAEMPGRHWSDKSLQEMTERDWRIFKEDFNISTKGGSLPHPLRNWKEAGFKPKVLEAIEKVGYKTPTPIQMQAIPIAMQGRDIMGIAETGSGKTAAFVLPMIEYILSLPPMTPDIEMEGPYALVMAPTRELVNQIEQECSRFASLCGLRTIPIVGGVSIEQQGFQLRKGCEIVIATPGRLNDMIETRYIVLNQCTYVVLDEADRMIDMGFEPQVNSILDAMPSTHMKSENEEEAAQQEGTAGRYRTTIMYSATMPAGVERLSRKFLRRPAYVLIGEVGKAVDRIEQRVEMVKDENEKRRRLVDLLNEGPPPPIIIFVNKKITCDSVSRQLEKLGWRAVGLHAGRNQLQREAAIDGFRAGKYDILIATDVAGRGIDVPGVTHVINFDMTKTIEDYTHRIGRTARAGATGMATSFVTGEDAEVMYDLKQMLQTSGQYVPPALANHSAAQVKPGTVAEKQQKRKDTVIYAK